jgi:hypothetical protein
MLTEADAAASARGGTALLRQGIHPSEICFCLRPSSLIRDQVYIFDNWPI